MEARPSWVSHNCDKQSVWRQWTPFARLFPINGRAIQRSAIEGKALVRTPKIRAGLKVDSAGASGTGEIQDGDILIFTRCDVRRCRSQPAIAAMVSRKADDLIGFRLGSSLA
jgi:hypothetical protein